MVEPVSMLAITLGNGDKQIKQMIPLTVLRSAADPSELVAMHTKAMLNDLMPGLGVQNVPII